MLKFALIGCGAISKRHAEMLGSNKIKGAALTAVCDIDLEKAKEVGNKYRVPFYSSMDDLMQKELLDVIVVLTPSGLHVKHVTHLSQYGKHIVVEKPMALSVTDANQMINSCEHNGCKLFVIKQNRFNLPIIQTKQALNEGRFGNLFLGTVRIRWKRDQGYYDKDSWRGTWDLDGGVLANQASHHLDLLLWMMGNVRSVFARSINAIANIDTEDTAVVLLQFENGALGLVEATTAIRPADLEGSISILGDKGSVVIGGFSANVLQVWNFSQEKEIDADVVEKHSTNPNIKNFPHLSCYQNIIEAINGNTEALIDGTEGRKSVELISAIYDSINLEKEIFL